MFRRPWGEDDDKVLRRLHSAGANDDTIAREMGRGQDTIASKRGRLGLIANRRKNVRIKEPMKQC